MNKKKSPSKASSNKGEVVKDKAIIDSTKADDQASQTSSKPEGDSQLETQAEKPVTPEQSGEPASSADEKTPTPVAKATDPKPTKATPAKATKAKRGFPVLGLINLLLIIGLVAAAFYYWQMQQQSEVEKQALLAELQSQLDSKANLAEIQTQLNPLKSGIGSSESRIDALQKKQKELQGSTEKLFDLYGRDDSDWQLAEVAYLMRVAQHKLALENDFEGAALTLQVASDTIAASADPGLLPVRVLISEEIADLKTRARPDLVGMTLLLSQMSQQIQSLKPGYQPAGSSVDIVVTEPTESTPTDATNEDATVEEKVKMFFSTLVTVKHKTEAPTTTEALIINIEEIMESNLKLTRWTVLERDDFQYRQLMQENVRLFKQYYDLDDAANNDFYSQLLQLQKSPIKPSKPSIDGSLQLLKNIISQRQNAPDTSEDNQSSLDQIQKKQTKINQTAPKAASEATDHV